MPNYKITTELTTYVWMPEDFDPEAEGDILSSLDMYIDEKDTWQTGWKMFEGAILTNSEHAKPRYEVVY